MILMIQTAYKYTFFGEDAEVCFEHDNVSLISDTALLVLVFRKPLKIIEK